MHADAVGPTFVGRVGAWGAASFDNDPANDWFFLVEEAVDPGGAIASALDNALSEADQLGIDEPCEAIAAAELAASCAGHAPERLPDRVRDWVRDALALIDDAAE